MTLTASQYRELAKKLTPVTDSAPLAHRIAVQTAAFAASLRNAASLSVDVYRVERQRFEQE